MQAGGHYHYNIIRGPAQKKAGSWTREASPPVKGAQKCSIREVKLCSDVQQKPLTTVRYHPYAIWYLYQPSLVPRPLSEKLRRGLVTRSGNTVIQCLVPKEFNQSRNHTLMFTYVVKIEGVRSCMACMIGKY